MPPLSENDLDFVEQTLQALIRIDTTNPPGGEITACNYLARIFIENGIKPVILESAPGRGNLVARLRGDGSLPPLLLTSHLDVVPAVAKNWQVPPFSGELHGDCVWGRGAVDMKNMTAMALAVFLKIAREKIPLKRDLIFAAVADEEAGSEFGARFLVEKHPDLVRAEYALNEVGGFSLDVEGVPFYPIGVAEKGYCWFSIAARGASGHGAMPHDDQALPHVCWAAHRLASENLPFKRTRVVGEFIRSLAAHLPFPKNLILRRVSSRFFSAFVTSKLMPDKARARGFKNMLHNLATPTMASAGNKINVIPGEAKISIDGRILPESTVAEFLQEVQNLIGPDFSISIERSAEAVETPYPTPLYDLLCATLKEHDPDAVPVPFLIPGFTDAKEYSKLGIKCYGFVPLKLPPDLNFGALYHGVDERVPVAALRFGTQVLEDVVRKFCTTHANSP